MKMYGTGFGVGEIKMYKIIYMNGAVQNLSEIENNLDEIDLRLADKILSAIEERIQTLQEMPFRYPAYLHNPKYRWTGVYRYMIFYKVREDVKAVEIHRILHGARDIENILDDEE